MCATARAPRGRFWFRVRWRSAAWRTTATPCRSSAAGGRAARVGAMIRRILPWLTLAVSGGMVACAEWAGSELRGPQLSIMPLIAIGPGTLLVDDLDPLHVVVVPISSAGAVAGTPKAVVDTTVPVDAAGNATLSVPVVVIGRSQPFEVTLQGIRSSDGVVLY